MIDILSLASNCWVFSFVLISDKIDAENPTHNKKLV